MFSLECDDWIWLIAISENEWNSLAWFSPQKLHQFNVKKGPRPNDSHRHGGAAGPWGVAAAKGIRFLANACHFQSQNVGRWGTVAIFRGTMMINHAWILLIVEISTPKPKSINFSKIKRKRTPERLFPLQNAFFQLQNGFERFFYFFFTFFEHYFPHSRTFEVSRTAKTTPVCFFPHQTAKSCFFGFGVKKSSIGKLQVEFWVQKHHFQTNPGA